MLHYIWWIPFLVIVYSLQAWLSTKNADGGALKWTTYLYIASMIPLWAVVSRYYKKEELNFVGGLFDILLMVTFQVTWIILGCAESWVSHQWAGLALVVSGFILMKI